MICYQQFTDLSSARGFTIDSSVCFYSVNAESFVLVLEEVVSWVLILRVGIAQKKFDAFGIYPSAKFSKADLVFF
jgi:hypothetical protein